MAISRSLSEVFVKDKHPILSFVFRAEEFNSTPFQSTHIIEVRNQKLLAACYEYKRQEEFTNIILIHDNYFYTKGGYKLRPAVRQALYHKYNQEILDTSIKKLSNKLWVGLVWTNCLYKVEALYDNAITELKIWDSKKEAKKDYDRLGQMLSWMTKEPVRHQKNVRWKEVMDSFSEYVDNANFPFDTLQSSFRSAAQKWSQRERLQHTRLNTVTCTSPVPSST